VALTNPFLYLQRNADENPRGIFSRSIDQVVTNVDAVVAVKRLAFELRRLGLQAGDVVALDLPAQLGVLFTEAVFHEAGVSTILPRDRAAWRGLDVRWLFSSRGADAPDGARLIVVDQTFMRRVDENPYGIEPSEAPIDILRIVFSSGTTGTPKAIALGRSMEQAMEYAMPTWFQGAPILNLMDASTAWGIGEFYIHVRGAHPFINAGGAAPSGVVSAAAEQGVRTLKGSPAQIAALVDELEAQDRTLPAVETVVVAGTVMPPGVAERMRRAAEGCRIFGNYGSTEAGGATTRLYESDDPFDAGHPIPGSIVEIVDEADQPVAPGTVGRIRHRSPGMASGYLGDAESTQQAFRDGWFYPGDLGLIRSDGGLTLTGRESEVLNAGGVKIDPNKLDHAALAHSGVHDACSFEYVGIDGVNRIGVALVTDDGFDVQPLIAALEAAYGSAAPKLVARVESVPRTVTGKPMRRALAERYRES
jgi:long-chain acyl-CoA synthetase